MIVQLTEVDQLLAGRSVGGLLEVRVEPGEQVGRALGDAIGLVSGPGAVCGVVLGVKIGQGVEEAGGNAVLVVQLDGTLDGGIANNVAVRKVLGDDPRPGLLLLCDLVGVTLGVGGGLGRRVVRGAGRRRHADVGGSKLGVVQEQSGLGGSLLLEGDGRGLGLALGLDIEAGDLAAEAEEVADLLVVGLGRDVLNVDSCGRHAELILASQGQNRYLRGWCD